MRNRHSTNKSFRQRGAAILEYVIIAVGIAIFCTFGILMFGKTAQSQMNQATQTLSGQEDANTAKVTEDTAKAAATEAKTDDTSRKGTTMKRD